MAPLKFAKAILNGDQIDVYNYGEMNRDFTYIDDLVNSIWLLVDIIPKDYKGDKINSCLEDSKSEVAPYRVVNIGNSKPEKLLDFIAAIGKSRWEKQKRNLMPMQAGDVLSTWADSFLLEHLTGYKPRTDLIAKIRQLVSGLL